MKQSNGDIMSNSSDLVSAVDDLMDSPGGQLLKQSRVFLRLKMKSIGFVFILGIIIGFPITRELISWLIEPSRLPDGVEIIVISPVEFIMLQLRIAMGVGVFFVITTLMYFGIFEGL